MLATVIANEEGTFTRLVDVEIKPASVEIPMQIPPKPKLGERELAQGSLCIEPTFCSRHPYLAGKAVTPAPGGLMPPSGLSRCLPAYMHTPHRHILL